MGSLIILVINLSRYKDDDVVHLQKTNINSIILELRVREEIQFN